MTVSVLSLFFSLNLSTAWAINCPAGTQGSDNTNDEISCGTNCCWGIDNNNVLTITPALDPTTNKPYTSVSMKNFTYTSPGISDDYKSQYSSNAPWARQGATSVVIENGIGYIGREAFIGDTKITSVTGMENVLSIGVNAFWGATSLTSVDMPNVTSVGQQAFYGATALTSADMLNVTKIEPGAFYNAVSLTSVDMPNVTTIETTAFSGTSLNDVNCLGTVQECEDLKTSMQSAGASFSDSQFHVIDTPTANCSGYSQGVCSTCKSGYNLSNGVCVANSNPIDDGLIDDYGDSEGCPEGKIAKGDECIDASQGCGANYKLSDGICYRVRYTPAEAAEVAGETNTIFLYYK